MKWGKPATCFACIASLLIGAWACSAANGADRANETGTTSTAGTGAGGGSSGSSGATSDGGQTGVGGSTSFIGGGAETGAGAGNVPDGGCVSLSSAAEQLTTTMEVTHEVTHEVFEPFDMLIMYDQSGSMGQDTPVGTKWDAIKAAVTGFVNSPDSVGIGVGIDYFPQILQGAPTNCTTDADCQTAAGNFGTCEGINIFIACLCACSLADNCQVPAYSTPEVGIDVLPGVAPAIINSLNMHSPQGNTPTRPALEGAHQYAHDWAIAHPDKKTIVVLATDGDPTSCTQNAVQDVANVAANALAATPSVQTFVIGVGSSLTSLNSIAAAGGTNQAFIVDATTGDPTQQFLDALNQIRSSVTVSMTVTDTVTDTITTPVDCEWTIPPPPDGETFDPNKVNVDFSSGGSTTQRIGAVATVDDCANVDGGWYFDSAMDPTKVLVCPQTCTVLQSINDAVVNVVFGCATEPAIVR